ncbi:MAG: metallophosphoesterase [Bryobacteraceae bacterium]
MPLITLPSRRDFFRTAGAATVAARWTAAQPKSIHWAILSDTHLSADPKNEYRGFRPYDNLTGVIPAVQKARPEVVLINGDLARLEGLPADYQLLKTMLQPIAEQTPLCLSLGNHDDRKNFLTALGKPAKGQPQPVQNRNVLVVDQPPVRILVLDSLMAVNQAPGLLGKAQRGWLDGYLKASDSTPILIFVHHPVDDSDTGLMDADRLLAIVTPHRKVKAIVYGHTHMYRYTQVDGIHLINVPAIGYNFTDSEPVGWVESVISTAGGEFTLHAFGGNMQGNGKTTSLHWRG